MRYDFAIIFGHGLPGVDQIKQIIRKHFPIVFLKEFDMLNVAASWSEERTNIAQILPVEKGKALLVDTFINRLYACDRVPLQHLFSKTRFLHTVPTKFLFCLLLNKTPDEQMVGVGTEFEHIQCQKITAMKTEVRDKFNPRSETGARLEHHVLHTSDFQSQVEHVLEMLALPTLNFFQRIPNENFNAEYHVEPFEKYTIEEIPLSSIRINLANIQNLTIKETPHYKYLQGYPEEYIAYCKEFVGKIDFSDHCAETFDRLIKDFDYNERNYVLVKKMDNGFMSSDGTHRLAILAHQGAEFAKGVIINVPHSNKIDTAWLWEHMPCRYAILRKAKHFPAYYEGDDIDILCDADNLDRFVAHVLRFARLCKVQKLEVAWHGPHCHLDFWFNGIMDLRVDLLSNLSPEYNISDAKCGAILSHAVPEQCGGITVYVPDYLDDLVLRFAEWRKHPEKIKHLRYLMNRVNEGFYPAVKEMLGVDIGAAGFDEILRSNGLV